jgi:hypothetical protein
MALLSSSFAFSKNWNRKSEEAMPISDALASARKSVRGLI